MHRTIKLIQFGSSQIVNSSVQFSFFGLFWKFSLVWFSFLHKRSHEHDYLIYAYTVKCIWCVEVFVIRKRCVEVLLYLVSIFQMCVYFTFNFWMMEMGLALLFSCFGAFFVLPILDGCFLCTCARNFLLFENCMIWNYELLC